MNITFTYAEVMKIVLVWKILTLVSAIIMTFPKILMAIRINKERAEKNKALYESKIKYEKIMNEDNEPKRKVIGFQTITIDKDSRT